MGCGQSKSKGDNRVEKAPASGGHFNFLGLDTEFARIFLEKHRKKKVVKGEDRHGNKVDKHVHDEVMTWAELVHGMEGAEKDEFGRKVGPLHFFWRKPEMEKKRKARYEANKEKWGCTADYLHVKLFGWDSEINDDGKLVAVKSESYERKIVWMPNDFPYAWEAGIQHDLLWATDLPVLSLKECNDMIRKHLPGKEFVWFTNSMAGRSVPEIDHIQILSRDVASDDENEIEVSADAVFTGP